MLTRLQRFASARAAKQQSTLYTTAMAAANSSSSYSTKNSGLASAALLRQSQQMRRFSTNDAKKEEENGASAENQAAAAPEEAQAAAAGGGESKAEISEEALVQVAKGKKPRQKKAKVTMPKAKGSFLKKGGGEFTKEELNKSQNSGSRRDDGSLFSRKQLYDLKQNKPEEYRSLQNMRWQAQQEELEDNLYREHRSRMAETEEFSDLETQLENRQAMDKIGVLKQVVTNPNYTSKQELFGKSSPQPQSINEQKEQALNKLAAFKKSAEVLSKIKSRLGKGDQSMKDYLIHELKKSGSEVGEFLAQEVNGGKATGSQKSDIKARSQAFLERKQQEAELKVQNQANKPLDSIRFGVQDQFGSRSFMPANEHDQFVKHSKMQVTSFKEYKEYTEKLRKEAEVSSRKKKEERYDELFERYNVPAGLRHYVFFSDLQKPQDKTSIHYHVKVDHFKRLASMIPEIALDAATPTYQDQVQREVRREIEYQTLRRDAINEARNPLIEKHLEELKPRFMEKNSHLSEQDMEKAWTLETMKHYQTLPDHQFKKDMTDIQEWSQGRAAGREPYQDPEIQGLTSTQIMENKMYQQINDQDSGPLSIDRVSRDGPRDRVGDLQDRIKSGPIYDFNKAPATEQANEMEVNAYHSFTAQGENMSPIDVVLKKDSGLKHHLEENYDYAKKVESAIDKTRQRLASDMLALQSQLTQIQTKKDSVQTLVTEKHVEEIESQVLPGQKFYNFTEFEEQASAQAERQLLEQESYRLLQSKAEFDPASRDPAVYERELKAHSHHALLSESLGKPVTDLSHFEYILNMMNVNKVQQTTQLDARLFEYAILADKPQIANELIQKLRKDGTESLSPIDPRFLRKYFLNSVKRDQIDATAYLVNYSDRYGVSLSNLPINNFRAALNHYLNDRFDLHKVMTFLKFYQKHFSDRAREQFGKIEPMQENISDEKIAGLSKAIFGESDGLVAMPELFDSLVDQIGSRQVIDPVTKEDSLWNLIVSQTSDKDFIRVTQQTQHSKIGGRSIARYLANQFDKGNSYDRTFRTALRVQGTSIEKDFFSELMQQLNAYSLKNMGKLPSSFTEKKLGDLYLRLKLSDAELSSAMSELLLFTLNKKQMHEQIVDFSTRSSQASTNEINKYYLAESLLQGNLRNKTYQDALASSQVFGSDEADLTACELAQRTKAIFLDRSEQAAVDFFRGELAKRQEKVQQRRDLMVALYDNVMGGAQDGQKVLSFEEFKSKHEKSKLFSQRLVTQAYAVNNLRKIVLDNDYQGIDDAFNLYMVLRQIKDILGDKYMLMDDGEVAKLESKISEDQYVLFDQLLDRKKQLERKLSAEDYQRVKEILEVTEDGAELDAMQGLKTEGLNRVLNMFQDMNFDEARQYTINPKKTASSSGGKASTKRRKKLSAQEQIQSMRTNLRQATNLKSLMASVTQYSNDEAEDDDIDWFQEFANAKQTRTNASIAKYIQKQTGQFAKNQLGDKKNEEAGITNAEESTRLLMAMKDNPALADKLAGMDVAEQEAYLYDMAKEAREFFEDPEMSEQDIHEIENEHLEVMQEYMEALIDAFDPQLELKLQLEHELHAKKVTLYKESIDLVRKEQLSKLDLDNPAQRAELFEYAKQINLLRFDVVELEHQHQEVCKEIEESQIEADAKQNPEDDEINNELKQQLYNQDSAETASTSKSISKANAFDAQMIRIGREQVGGLSDPKAILEHFDMREKQQIVAGTNHNMLMNYQDSILPEQFHEIEVEACEAAVNHLLDSNDSEGLDAAEEVGESAKGKKELKATGQKEAGKKGSKQEVTQKQKKSQDAAKSKKSDWAAKFNDSIENEKKLSYSMYYYGKPEHEVEADSQYSHPRQVMNDLDDASLSDQSRDLKVLRRMGIQPEKYANFDKNEFINEEFRDANENEKKLRMMVREEKMNQVESDALNKRYSNIIDHPIEYFERKKISEQQSATYEYRTDRMFDQQSAHKTFPWLKEEKLNAYLDRMLENPIPYKENVDPINLYRAAHDNSIIGLKEQLTKAIGEKKADALPIAIQIFNRIQEKAVKTSRLQVKSADDESQEKEMQSINEQLSQVQILLNDPSSPLISKLRSSSKYATQKLPETIDEYRAQVRDGNIVAEPVDLNTIINDYRQMTKAEDHVQTMQSTLQTLTTQLDQAEKSLKKDRITKSAYNKAVKKAQKEKERKNEEYLSNLYTEYLQANAETDQEGKPGYTNRGSSSYADISDTAKASLMRDAFRVEQLGGTDVIDTSAFPAFYALDLIQFGLRREIPAAIRLGELVLAEIGNDLNDLGHQTHQAQMPRELAQAVKEFMIEHQDSYQDAAKYTGPINNTAIYHQARQANSTVEKPVFFTVDDPYWYEFQQRNYRREDNWRLPSVLAWDHKPKGILGEVLDLDRLEKSYSEYFGDEDQQQSSSMKM